MEMAIPENRKLPKIHEHLAFFLIFGPVDLIKIRGTRGYFSFSNKDYFKRMP